MRPLRAWIDHQHLESLLGTAIDLTIDNFLDARGDEQIPFGLHLVAGIFNANGWYWGAGFTTEDAHHFEAGSALIQTW